MVGTPSLFKYAEVNSFCSYSLKNKKKKRIWEDVTEGSQDKGEKKLGSVFMWSGGDLILRNAIYYLYIFIYLIFFFF